MGVTAMGNLAAVPPETAKAMEGLASAVVRDYVR